MSEIEDVKQQTDIVDLVGHYVSLKKAGANFKGLCPFHHERSSSFMVNPERQIYKCFGCNKGGDALSFIQEVEHIEFGDALKLLADRAGIVLKPRTQPKPGEAPSEKSRYYQVNSLAAQVFHRILLEHSIAEPARQYLAKRGVTTETIKLWRIGYAPRQKVLQDFLLKRGFNAQEIERGGKPTMFYDRIMFPIVDSIGNTVGFTGRILGQGEPKYLNTPETPIFHKSRIIFGLDKARAAIKEKGQVIVAEGQMDVISAYQAGTRHIVATSGTALTQDHLRILSRYDADILFAFDADSAGQAATQKAVELAYDDKLSVKVITLPTGVKDIGELVEKDPATWLEVAAKPMPVIEWHINSVMQRYKKGSIDRKLSVDEKKLIAKELIPSFNRLGDVIEQAHYVQLLAKRLDVKEEVIQQAMRKAQRGSNPQNSQPAKSERPSARSLTSSETLLGLFEINKEAQLAHENLYKLLKEWYNQPITDLIFLVQEKYRGLSPAEIKAEIALLVRRHADDEKDRLKADFARKISDAEANGDREGVKKLLLEFQQLIKS